MKWCALLLLAFVCVHGAPTEAPLPNSCKNVVTDLVAGDAIHKINQDRTSGYIFRPERVSNVHQTRHGNTGVVFYLTVDIIETKCHVLSKKSYKDCENRGIGENPVYGQCKAVIYVNRPHRVSRLYKYSCSVRPLAASKIIEVCPDCPVLIPLDNTEVVKTANMGLEKFNKESLLPNFFAILNITRAKSQGGLITMYNAEFTIQETVCSNKTELSEVSKCELMSCEFAHKGFCRATHTIGHDRREYFEYKCEIYEPEAAEVEKERHLEKTDHHHANNASVSAPHDHSHDHTSPHSHPTTHDHDHAAEKGQDHKHQGTHAHGHANNHGGHHHTHEHDEGHGKAHGHAHSHEHSHDPNHDHVHVHHGKAHIHTHDQGVHPAHHNYGHTEGETHEHDHELALDHEHKHGHLHEHEHHHHHHQHSHEPTVRKLQGVVHVLPSLDRPVTLPFFPDEEEKPDTPTGLPLRPDPDIPGENEPVIGRFPKTLSADCPAEFVTNDQLIKAAFAEDPEFKVKSAV